MHPQILQTWPVGRQALVIGTHNLAQNNGRIKNFVFTKFVKNDDKKNRLQDFYLFSLHV